MKLTKQHEREWLSILSRLKHQVIAALPIRPNARCTVLCCEPAGWPTHAIRRGYTHAHSYREFPYSLIIFFRWENNLNINMPSMRVICSILLFSWMQEQDWCVCVSMNHGHPILFIALNLKHFAHFIHVIYNSSFPNEKKLYTNAALNSKLTN